MLNYVIGPAAEAGDELVANPLSRLITLTGSTETGRHVMRLAADHIKRLSLELGGQSPLLVLDDADLSKVVPAAVRRSYSNSGQICIAVNRVFVADAVADDFADAFVDLARRLRIGYGLDEGVEFGPLPTSRPASARPITWPMRARGARRGPGRRTARRGRVCPRLLLRADGPDRHRPEHARHARGDVWAGDRHRALRSAQSAIAAANATPYGLAAYVFGGDLERCLWVAERLEAGGVGVNLNDVTELAAPFGGWKESGSAASLGQRGWSTATS